MQATYDVGSLISRDLSWSYSYSVILLLLFGDSVPTGDLACLVASVGQEHDRPNGKPPLSRAERFPPGHQSRPVGKAQSSVQRHSRCNVTV